IEIGRGYWKFNVSLLKDRAYVGYIRGIIRQARETRGDGDWDDPGEWWDFLKFLLRAETVAYCREKEEKRREYVAALLREKEELENDVWYGIGGEEAGADLRRIYHLLEEEEGRKAEGHRVRARVPNFGAKEPGLAYISKIEKWTGGRNLIYALKDREGRVRYGTEGVLDIAHEFYTDLYTSQGTDEQAQDEILDALDSTLTPESRDMCDARVTAEELAESLRGLQNGKSPGSDGFPAEFWKCFWGELSADFMAVVDWVYNNGRLTGSMAGGIIRLLFKKGDRLDVRNYRPITLVNADYKIISKTIARRMAKVLPELIHPDQTCVPGRHISTNIHVLRDVVEYCDGADTEGALLFLDQEKCFDRVEHGFIFRVMAKMGYGEDFIKWVRIF
ncbi:MAG: reverse transcriptase family protein, partial [Bacteroidota bacterium]